MKAAILYLNNSKIYQQIFAKHKKGSKYGREDQKTDGT